MSEKRAVAQGVSRLGRQLPTISTPSLDSRDSVLVVSAINPNVPRFRPYIHVRAAVFLDFGRA